MSPIKWKNYHGVLIPNVPPHQNINLSLEEQKQLLNQSGAYFLRWTSDFDTPHESSFWYVLKNTPEKLETYNSKVRNQIKKGLKHCEVRPISSETLQKEGYISYQKALKSYGISKIPNEKTFKENIRLLSKDWEFWGIYSSSGDMIGYAQNQIIENTCNYSTVKFDPDFLNLYPGYALFFTMNTHYLNKRQMRYVHDGSRSLSHETNIQKFLCSKFQFRKAYCTMHIAYRTDIAIIAKMLYPFHKMIETISIPLFQKLSVLLKHENIRRNNGHQNRL